MNPAVIFVPAKVKTNGHDASVREQLRAAAEMLEKAVEQSHVAR